MNVKTLMICAYIMLIYWISLHVSHLDTLFFPTLGAFGFLFITRSFRFAELGKITLGAFITSTIGTTLVYIYPSAVSVFVNVLIAIWLIKKFQWNAPPIVAVSLIPFFSETPQLWTIPISVTVVMLGLMLTLFLAMQIESKGNVLLSMFSKKKLRAEASDSVDISM